MNFNPTMKISQAEILPTALHFLARFAPRWRRHLLPRNTEHTLVEIHKAKVHLFALTLSAKSLADLTKFASHVGQMVRFVLMPIL